MDKAYLHSISTAVPAHRYDQKLIAERMKQQYPGDRLTQRMIHHIYAQSGIEQRHSVLADLEEKTDEMPLFFLREGMEKPGPAMTGQRNRVYTEKVKPLIEEAGSAALKDAHASASEVTHLITVSCTGFFAPGPDYHLIRALELSTSVQRFHLGFMGCFAAFPALRLAHSICSAQPDAVVLIVIAELCTLHLRFNSDPDTLISNSVFADGAAAAVVKASKPATGKTMTLVGFDSQITPNGEQDMAWTIGDEGFEMKLSTYVPDIIEQNITSVLNSVLEKHEFSPEDITHWAIHPGGRAILDKVESALSLAPSQLQSSREILARYGNMSAATILFVLKHLWETSDEVGTIFATAFGPGLTVESALLRLENA